MATATRGDFVLVSSLGPEPWPAIVITEMDLPVDLQGPPSGYHKPVLILQQLKFYWAAPSDLLPLLDLICPDRILGNDAALASAYDDIQRSLYDGWTVDNWLSHSRETNHNMPTPEPQVSRKEDEELKRALQASLEDFKKRKRSSSRSTTPNPSSSKRSRGQALGPRPLQMPDKARLTIPDIGDTVKSDPTIDNDWPRSDGSDSDSSRSRTLGPEDGRAESLKTVASFSSPQGKAKVTERASSIQRTRQHQGGAIREQSTNSEELKNHEDYVDFPVGPNGESFVIRLEAVRKKHYLTGSNVHGFHFLLPKDGGGWVFQRPGVERIDPESFRLFAQYVEDDDFGIMRIHTDEDRDTSFAECASAWEVAERFGAEDLMDLIVKKFKRTLPWKPEEILAFAKIVYQTDAIPLPAIESMKKLLTGFVRQNFLDYLETHHTVFVRLLRGSSCFLKDVLGLTAQQGGQEVAADSEQDEE